MLNGKYSFRCETPLGNQEGIIALCQDDGALSGSFSFMDTTAPIEDGRVNGNEFSFGVNLATIYGTHYLEVSGCVVDDNLTGSLKAAGVELNLIGTGAE